MGELATILAALGGALMGMGLGLALSQRRIRQIRRQHRRVSAKTRSTVIPLLERRAEQLHIPRERRAYQEADTLKLAVDLASAILEVEDRQHLPWSDTVEAPVESLTPAPPDRQAG